MARRPNYRLERADRARKKAKNRAEKLAARMSKSAKAKLERVETDSTAETGPPIAKPES